jgi:predicted nucleic acid-binding protein
MRVRLEKKIQIDLETVDKSFHEIISLAYSEQLTTYNAAYLELAIRTGLPLATKDKQLQESGQKLGMQLLAV